VLVILGAKLALASRTGSSFGHEGTGYTVPMATKLSQLGEKLQRRILSLADRLARYPRLQRQTLSLALRFTSPELQLRALVAKHRHDDITSFVSAHGIKPETVERMSSEGLDNPGYRFHRDGPFYDYFFDRTDLRGASWLDVGADTGCVDAYLADMLDSSDFELCDLNVATNTAFPVRRFDGTSLDYAEDSFDLVFFSYVLHHAADNTIGLLRDAHRIARKHVVVLEDPKETEDDYRWAYAHDRAATFRGSAEWQDLFGLLGFDVQHEASLGSDIHSRSLYVLTPRQNK
jgi:SAM-dependent methyltransferase